MASSPTKTVRPIITDGSTTHFSWTVHFSTNDTPDRKQGKISVARVAKELSLSGKKALKESESQAHQAAQDFIDTLKKGGQVRCGYTLESWCDYYFPNKLANEADEKYAAASHSIVRLHVYPILGKVKLTELTWMQLEAWWKDLCNTPFAAPIYDKSGKVIGAKKPIILKWKTTDHIRQRLTKALDAAVQRGMMPFNPAKSLSANRKERKAYLDDLKTRKRWFTVDELKKLRTVSKGTSLYGTVLLQSDLAVRIAEACGTEISDVDLDSGFISTVKQLRRQATKEGMPTSLQLSAPKGDGMRVFIASPELIAFAKERKAEEVLKGRDERCSFLCVHKGNPIDPNWAGKAFRMLCESNGIELAPGNSTHAIRRTVLNMMKNAPGLSAEVRAFIAGHDDASTTLIYDEEVLTSAQKTEMAYAAAHVRSLLAA